MPATEFEYKISDIFEIEKKLARIFRCIEKGKTKFLQEIKVCMVGMVLKMQDSEN